MLKKLKEFREAVVVKYHIHRADISMDSTKRAHHARALMRIGSPEAVKAAGNYAHVDILAKAASPRAVDNIIEHGLKSDDLDVVKGSVLLLGRIGGEKAVDGLIKEGLQHEHPIVAEVSAAALGKLGDKKALLPLMKLAGHEEPFVNKAVKKAIRQIQVVKRA